MKFFIILLGLIGLLCKCSAESYPEDFFDMEKVVTSSSLERIQMAVLHSLEAIGSDYKCDHDFDYMASFYTKYADQPHPPDELRKSYEKGHLLPKSGIFTLNCPHVLADTVRLFDMLYNAKNEESYFTTVCWMKEHVHPMQFLYVFLVSLQNPSPMMRETRDVILPPLYEIVPHYFVNTEVIHDIYYSYMRGEKEKYYHLNNTGYEYSFHSSMMSGFLAMGSKKSNSEEIRLSYFREDPDLNNFYYTFHTFNSPWFRGRKADLQQPNRELSMMYYMHHMLFARYNVERVAVGLPPVDVLYWAKPIKHGYNPHLANYNGHMFTSRPDNIIPENVNPADVYEAYTLESRLLSSIGLGEIFYKDEDTHKLDSMTLDEDRLANVIHKKFQINSTRTYYGEYFYRSLYTLASLPVSNEREYTTGVLDNTMTALRDPAYYMFLHRLMLIYQSYFIRQGSYPKKSLSFPDFEIKNVKMDKLETFFDYKEYDITHALNSFVDIHHKKTGDLHEGHKYVAKQFTLNHEAFTYKLVINNKGEAKEATVHVFLGPKYDSEGREVNMDQARMAYYPIDKFVVNLKSGENTIIRKDRESRVFFDRHESFHDLYEKLEHQKLYKFKDEVFASFPHRLLLPMGTESGEEYNMFFMVTKYKQYDPNYDPTTSSSNFVFPFERYVSEDMLEEPNMMFHTVKIYHMDKTHAH